MAKARILWAPYPYKAGFCITDDTDYSSFTQIKSVYDFLDDIGFRTTKTVWSFQQQESCGLPPYAFNPDPTPTLESTEYADYIDYLYRQGFEISSHGASAGNNNREMSERSIAMLQERYGNTDTFIQHSKNADNLYYEEKVAPNGLFRWLLKFYSRNICSGEVPGSPYYWGDICRAQVKQVRLFRTRSFNTLKVNPSMPYYDPQKPLVQSWFSATRRAFHHAASPEALTTLKRERGLTVLYQYLRMYVDKETGAIDDEFVDAAHRLAEDPEIWVDTTRAIMERLRTMHGVVLVANGGVAYLVNTNPHAVSGMQIEFSRQIEILPERGRVEWHGTTAVFPSLAPESVTHCTFDRHVSWSGIRTVSLPRSHRISVPLPCGTLHVNCSASRWMVDGCEVKPGSFHLALTPGLEDFRPMSTAGFVESYRMFFHQMWIILRQMLFMGRSFNTMKFGRSKNKKLHSHLYW